MAMRGALKALNNGRNAALREACRPRLTPDRVVLLARQALERGPSVVYQDWFVAGRILDEYINPHRNEPPNELPVHIVGGIGQGIIGFWALAS